MIRRHELEPADNRRLAHLCGPLDAHLRSIEAALQVTLARRDASFRIEGARDAVERTATLLDTLYERARAPIGDRSLQLALKQALPGPELAAVGHRNASAPDGDAPVVLHTRHADLAGRTSNRHGNEQQGFADYTHRNPWRAATSIRHGSPTCWCCGHVCITSRIERRWQ